LISKLISELPGGVTLIPARSQIVKLKRSGTKYDDPYRPLAQDYFEQKYSTKNPEEYSYSKLRLRFADKRYSFEQMILITAYVVRTFEDSICGCLGSIDITGDWIGTLPFALSYAYIHMVSKQLSQIDQTWNAKLADNRNVGSLSRKI